MKSDNLTFAQLGDLFNDATTRLVGGVNEHNSATIQSDLARVQTGLEHLIQTQPAQFGGVAGIHAQNIVDQINLEMTAIKSVGTDAFAAKYINDVQRDLIDIVQGDSQLHSLATQGGHNGFGAVPSLLVPPAQFQGNAQQTDFMKSFVTTSQSFADRAVALADAHADPQAAQQLIGEMQTYAQTVNAFTQAQGGLYSARFNNEFASDGVNGTATRAMIDGLSTGNADKVHAAAQVMVANAADVAGNMLGIGVPHPVTGNGIPDHIDSFAQAGVVFNDATAKLIGGVYDGNRASIHNDLTAAEQGIKDLLAQHSDQFQGRAGADASKIISLLGTELGIVDNANAGPNAVSQLNHIQREIIAIVQHDTVLANAANQGDANGFMKLPGVVEHQIAHGGDPHGHELGRPNPAGSAASAPAATITAADAGHAADPLAHIFTPHTDPHFG